MCPIAPQPNKPEQNQEEMRRALQHHTSADLCVFPELSAHGYNCDISRIAEYADGPTFKVMSKYAQQYRVGVVYGFVEKDESGHYYCSAMVIDKNGICLLCYRKTHLFITDGQYGSFERPFTRGDRLGPLITLGDIKIGILICYDLEMAEPARVLSMMGADVLVVLAAYPSTPVLANLISTRAKENAFYLVFVNGNGEPFFGESFFVHPTGRFRSTKLPMTALIEAKEVEFFEVRRKERLAHRNSDLYRLLVEK
jgi:5-aminopentanamidase